MVKYCYILTDRLNGSCVYGNELDSIKHFGLRSYPAGVEAEGGPFRSTFEESQRVHSLGK